MIWTTVAGYVSSTPLSLGLKMEHRCMGWERPINWPFLECKSYRCTVRKRERCIYTSAHHTITSYRLEDRWERKEGSPRREKMTQWAESKITDGTQRSNEKREKKHSLSFFLIPARSPHFRSTSSCKQWHGKGKGGQLQKFHSWVFTYFSLQKILVNRF